MTAPRVTATDIPDVLLIEPKVFEDERGYFFESWNDRDFVPAGLDLQFVQDNHSHSGQGVLRGLHYQVRHTQGKLVRVVRGEVFDVAVDLRRSSATFGKWTGVQLSARIHSMLWIPPGFAHGFYVLSETADLLYKSTDFYSPSDDRTLRWDDPDLAIVWPLLSGREPIVSTKDAVGSLLRNAETFE